MNKNMINVTKTFLPPIEDYIKYLQQIWDSHQLTNHGPLVQELETKLKEYLGVKHLFFVSNGTIALQIAIKALGLHDEVITTPFSYVATTSSLVWEGCQPVYVDIDPNSLCIDPNLVEAAITEQTTGILATHVYGIPCNVEKIRVIAEKHGLKVLYDAAHTFGGKYRGKSIASYGDVSILSFHATKLFQTAEGGAIITENDELAHRLSYMLNFGHRDEEAYWGLGINGKNSELHAAMGLCNLPFISEIISIRKRISEHYDNLLGDTKLLCPMLPEATDYNYAYFPVIFPTENQLLRSINLLKSENIHPRRYFYPPLNTLMYTKPVEMKISESISSRILCLPLSTYLKNDEVERISSIILKQI